MSYANVGKVWTVQSFKEYLLTLKKPAYVKSVTIHHTGAPSLEQRKNGLLIQHIHNIKSYYQSLGWNRGPHLFIDEDQIFGMTPLNVPGIHAVSFNRTSIGVEILGNYDIEDPMSGRGLQCINNTAAAVKALIDWLDIPINENTIKFHRDDPRTSKSCPGKKVSKSWFISLVKGCAHQQPKAATPVLGLSDDEIGIVDYAVKQGGYSYSDAVKLLKTETGKTTFNKIWIESARYDSKKGTLARASELESAISRRLS
jgi:N-acetylmuramoyl-L-alanine amidase CwlA